MAKEKESTLGPKLDPMTEAEAHAIIRLHEGPDRPQHLYPEDCGDYGEAKALVRGIKLGELRGQKDMRKEAEATLSENEYTLETIRLIRALRLKPYSLKN